MISTRGRYALRVLVDLAEHGGGSYLPMKEVANRQEISLKYIERLMPALKAAGLIDTFIGTPFSGEERHVRRIGQIARFERDGTLEPDPRAQAR